MLGFDFQKMVLMHRYQNQFQDLGQIGKGGFSQVRKVKHRIDGLTYALKIIKMKPSKSQQETQQRLFSILSESQILSQLKNDYILDYHGSWIELQIHDNTYDQEETEEQQEDFVMVVEEDSSDGFVFASNSASQQSNKEKRKSKNQRSGLANNKLSNCKQIRLFILSQLCEMSLNAYLYNRNRQKGMSQQIYWEKNCQLALQMTKGLSYLHSKRVIHRDLKLQNIVLNAQSHVKIIDFGLAKKAKYWKTSANQQSKNKQFLQVNLNNEEQYSKSVGTRLFSSPQQANSTKYDHRTDIFSLAIIIVLLFCSFTTVHQQRDLIQKIRLRQLDHIHMPSKLKNIMFQCLGPQNERPALTTMMTVMKQVIFQSKKLKMIQPFSQRITNTLKKTDCLLSKQLKIS